MSVNMRACLFRSWEHPALLRSAAGLATLLLLAFCLQAQALANWPRVSPAEAGLDESQLALAREYAMRGGGSGYVVHKGKLVYSWGDPRELYDLKSTTKSIGVTALGLALADGKLSLESKAVECLPEFGAPPEENRHSGWLERVTLFHLATQTAGFAKPGGFEPIGFEPGTRWAYSDGGPNWLADCLTVTYGRDLEDLLFERVFFNLGITRDDLRWRANAYRPQELHGVARREMGSGIHANVDAMARIGLLYLRDGAWGGKQILPRDFVERASRPLEKIIGLPEENAEQYPGAAAHYGLLWWNNGDGRIEGVPRDAFWSWGLYDSMIVVIPSLDLVAARAGKGFLGGDWEARYARLVRFLRPLARSLGIPHPEGWDAGYDRLVQFLRPLVRSLGMPYPQSPVFSGLAWAGPETVVRKAEGSDNWPATWADDDQLYTAYGDGWGFEPKVDKKLSMGFARVTGGPEDFEGVNIRSPTGETVGQGAKGVKASGMLMVDGVLYLLARNAGNARLARSDDRGKTWNWADWRFTESFGAPTFLNFGKNYGGARDGYVYIYSLDMDSAYASADGLVLARVPSELLPRREAYEFFAGFDDEGRPVWSKEVASRKPVFRNPGRVYRSGVSYHAPSKRYLLCQVIPGEDTRFEGGFGIYDAPEPWGPWTTVYYTARWDMGPGETCSIPTKWMGEDTLHMLFSGDDSFSVRKAEIRWRESSVVP